MVTLGVLVKGYRYFLIIRKYCTVTCNRYKRVTVGYSNQPVTCS